MTMRLPLANGTVLQNRYHLLSILGQGGFGRTYLAEDQGRFNELCALKELIPAQGGEYALEKSKELFQREAQILYQIQHPQIPQFRATFEEDQRLFLVQDFVEGPTYRRLLDYRKTQGQTFSEGEVKWLLQQLLPVLAHIHSKGIIHRDIAPDNIILRELDKKPVLIDFGVVKELATRFQSMTSVSQPTTVGKPGYAPIEQMQTGQAFPCSDLYSLAVTVVVLLTGREPQELFDNSTLTWHWERWTTTSPLFAQVLNRMLSYRPGDRYQSAGEVLQALQSPQVPVPTPAPVSAPVAAPPTTTHTASQTIAVGRRADEPMVAAATNPANPTIEPPRVSVWDEPWAVALIGLALILLTGIGSWAIVRMVLNQTPTPSPPVIVESPTPTPSPTATVTPSPSPKPTEPVVFSQRLDIPADTKVSRSGSLKANETVNYILSGAQEQLLSAALSGEGVLMSVLGPNQEPVGDRAQRVSFWQGVLPYTGDYIIQLSPVRGLSQASYQLDVTLKSPAPPSPSPSPIPSPSPTPPGIETAQITFPPESNQTSIYGRATPQVIKRYLVSADKGEVLGVRVYPRDGVRLDIRYPNGKLVEDASGVLEWESKLTRSGDYQIDVVANREVDFQLDIRLETLLR